MIELPLDVVVQQWGGGQWSVPRLLVILEPGSELKLIERHLPSNDGSLELTTGVFEFFLGRSARLQHVRLCSRGQQQAELTTTAVQVAADAHYHCWTATNRGMLTRFDTHVSLVGPGARADLDGLYIASGTDIVDHHTRVIHECENTTVQETYKGIVDDRAQAVFDGQIVVRPGAMGTNAQQFNRNLLMSDQAIVHTKPQLEIDADDVTCSHGATVGKLDEQQLFYLQSRGISGEQAKRILTTAFAAELIDRCPIKQASLLDGYLAATSSEAE
jgi:Fe-S cluster assembly protein SufD